MSEIVMIDTAVWIGKDLFKKLDKKIREDKDVPEPEMKLWTGYAHLLPEKYNKELVKFLEDFVKNYGKK